MNGYDGIILIDKPAGCTSFDVIARLRGITHMKRIGHAGTLDPMATGVLPVFFGRAAKAVDILPNHDKTYLATFALGVTTDTQDNTGEVLSRHEIHVKQQAVESAIREFAGEQEQTPPMYSAVRVNGQRLYDLARRGIETRRAPRKITVYSIELISADEIKGIYTIRVLCSRGTYIRTLCHDLGQKLGCGAVMTALRRETACGFSLAGCLTLEQVQRFAGDDKLDEHILPVSTAFSHLKRLVLTEKQSAHFCNGVALGLSQFPELNDDGLAIYSTRGDFLGIAQPDRERGTLTIIKLFSLRSLTS